MFAQDTRAMLVFDSQCNYSYTHRVSFAEFCVKVCILEFSTNCIYLLFTSSGMEVLNNDAVTTDNV